MLQELRDYWLPLMLFVGALLIAGVLLLLVAGMPFLIEYPFAPAMLDIFASDGTVRRSSIAGAIGLIVTAFVFFRPQASIQLRKNSPKKAPPDRMPNARDEE